MAVIYIDNRPHEVRDGQNLLHACLSLGFDIPYFCWHPALHSVGACRVCAVKQFRDEKDTRGKIVMSCMTPAADGTRLSIDDPEAKRFRAAVIEWLMVNHPHDCPVCDEGGECHLQDMTVMTGHTYRRFSFNKRTYRNQYLGPFVHHEMNRCIQCYRCVRFYRDYAGGRDLDVFGSSDRIYFGRHEEGTLENEFSGNLVEVCPTGVFTDKTQRHHYARKWDLQTTPSICVHCGLGCNTIVGERYGSVRRVLNRFNGEVNGYFLCDRGRFGYEFVNSERRIRRISVNEPAGASGTDRGKATRSIGKEEALERLGELLHFGAGVIGIGSPRASLEANFALRCLVGAERFSSGISEADFELTSAIAQILRDGPAYSASLEDVRSADVVLVLGEDVTNTAPLLALSLRQSVRTGPIERAAGLHVPEWDDTAVRTTVQHEKGPLFIVTPDRTRLNDVATGTYQAPPDGVARVGFGVAHVLNPAVPLVKGLTREERSVVEAIAEGLRNAQRPVVISGTGCASKAVIEAAANVAWALCREGKKAGLSFCLPECNSLGVTLLGAGLEHTLGIAESGSADTVIVLENDLYRRAEGDKVKSFLENANHLIVIDCFENATAESAHLLLPSATYAESEGTLISSEGRAQRFFKALVSTGDVQESWRWLRDMLLAAGRTEGREWQTLDDVTQALGRTIETLGAVTEAAPPATFRIKGMKIPRQPHRFSGRTAMTAHVSVHEPGPPDDPDSPLSFTMEGFDGQPPSSLTARYWLPGWNSVQALSRYLREVGSLNGGGSGRRLIEPKEGAVPPFFEEVPKAFKPGEGEWLIVPLYHIFGTEELSVMAPGIAERVPQPYVSLGSDDARALGVAEGEVVVISLSGRDIHLPVRVSPALSHGVVGLPVGLPGIPCMTLPAFCSVKGRGKE